MQRFLFIEKLQVYLNHFGQLQKTILTCAEEHILENKNIFLWKFATDNLMFRIVSRNYWMHNVRI